MREMAAMRAACVMRGAGEECTVSRKTISPLNFLSAVWHNRSLPFCVIIY
jgi:hypothetical protein